MMRDYDMLFCVFGGGKRNTTVKSFYRGHGLYWISENETNYYIEDVVNCCWLLATGYFEISN